MKSIEIINVRLSIPDNASMIQRMFREIKRDQVKGTDQSPSIQLFQNTDIMTDWSIILTQEHEKRSVKTRIGQLIAEAFHAFGLVNHSVWIGKD